MKMFKFCLKIFIVEDEILKRKCIKDNTFDALSEINIRMMNATQQTGRYIGKASAKAAIRRRTGGRAFQGKRKPGRSRR